MEIDHVRSRFIKHFDGKTGNIYASPGRINIIGEHTDYNGGYVMPGAIDNVLMAEIRPNGTNTIMCYSITYKDRVEFAVDDPVGPRASWARYIYGVVQEMRKRGVEVKGFNIAYDGDVPIGAGMSSSAAFESCVACGLNDLFANNKISKLDMALVGQATEHNYCGVKCGIMDQFASIFGKKDNIIKLDCRTLEYEYVPFKPEGYKLVLLDSLVKHELASSAYNARRQSCENIISALKAKYPEKEYDTLRDTNLEEIATISDKVSAEDVKRAVFFFGEMNRVMSTVVALQKGDYETVGMMMYNTHDCLSKIYEVSCEEIDFLNMLAHKNGVTGSRLMGGGFGGCTINLVKDELYDSFIADAVQSYGERYGKRLKVYDVNISDGSRRVK